MKTKNIILVSMCMSFFCLGIVFGDDFPTVIGDISNKCPVGYGNYDINTHVGCILNSTDLQKEINNNKLGDLSYTLTSNTGFLNNDTFGVIYANRNLTSLPVDQTLVYSGGSFDCKKQLQGFFFEEMMGERVLPLSEEDRNTLEKTFPSGNYDIGHVTVSGGLYTDCNIDIESDGILDTTAVFGIVTVNDSSKADARTLVAGYAIDNNNDLDKAKSLGLRKSLIIQNQSSSPVGYIYDTHSFTFVGGYISSGADKLIDSINNKGDEIEDLRYDEENRLTNSDGSINVQDTADSVNFSALSANIIGRSNIKNKEKGAALDDSGEVRGMVANGLNININLSDSSSIINKYEKFYEKGIGNLGNEYCKGIDESESMQLTGNNNLWCIKESSYDKSKKLDLNIDDLKGKIVYVKNMDINLVGKSMIDGDLPINLIVMNGNVYLPDINSPSDLIDIDENGLPGVGKTKAFFLKGTLIIKGLLLGSSSGNKFFSKFSFEGIIHILNTMDNDKVIARETYIESLFGQNGLPIKLEDIFVCGDDTVTGPNGSPKCINTSYGGKTSGFNSKELSAISIQGKEW